MLPRFDNEICYARYLQRVLQRYVCGNHVLAPPPRFRSVGCEIVPNAEESWICSRPNFVVIERRKLRVRAVIHHQRLTLGIHHFAVAEPPAKLRALEVVGRPRLVRRPTLWRHHLAFRHLAASQRDEHVFDRLEPQPVDGVGDAFEELLDLLPGAGERAVSLELTAPPELEGVRPRLGRDASDFVGQPGAVLAVVLLEPLLQLLEQRLAVAQRVGDNLLLAASQQPVLGEVVALVVGYAQPLLGVGRHADDCLERADARVGADVTTRRGGKGRHRKFRPVADETEQPGEQRRALGAHGLRVGVQRRRLGCWG